MVIPGIPRVVAADCVLRFVRYTMAACKGNAATLVIALTLHGGHWTSLKSCSQDKDLEQGDYDPIRVQRHRSLLHVVGHMYHVRMYVASYAYGDTDVDDDHKKCSLISSETNKTI